MSGGARVLYRGELPVWRVGFEGRCDMVTLDAGPFLPDRGRDDRIRLVCDPGHGWRHGRRVRVTVELLDEGVPREGQARARP